MKSKQQNRARTARSRFLILMVVIVMFSCSQSVLAQWTTPNPTTGNINNTNSGNVGVGTTTPEFPLQVNGATSNVLGMVYTGTLSPTSGAGIQSLNLVTPSAADQRLGFYTFGVRNGSTSLNPVAIQGFSSQAWTLNSAHGGYLTFSTTPNGSTTRTERLRINHDGYVGIGTTAPPSPLTVVAPGGVRQGFQLSGSGNAFIYTDLRITPVGTIATGKPADFAWSLRKDAFYGNDSSGPSMVMEIWRQGGGTYAPFIINPNGDVILAGANNATNGFVGIGTTNPLFKLDVKGGNLNAPGLCIAGVCKTDWSQVSGGGSSPWMTSPSPSTNIFYNTGNVGLGTASPSTRLHISAGDSSFALFGPNTTWGGTLAVGSGAAFVSPISGRAQVLSSNGNLHLDAGTNQNVYVGWLTASNTIINGQGGNVGIGTSNPLFKLDVKGGNLNAPGLCIAGVCKTDWSQVGGSGTSQWSEGPNFSINYSTGNVGIGTSNPAAMLSLSKSQAGGTEIRIDNTHGAGFAGVYLNGGLGVSSGGFLQYNNASGNRNLFVGSGGGDPLYLGTNNSVRMTVMPSTGNVGIATTAPTEKLEVTGNLKLSGTGNITAAGTIEGNVIKAKYQDVAEWVDSSQELAAGTVVVLDVSKSNHVTASTKSYDSRIAGVISLQPGLALGEAREGRVLVATTGRVKVKVDASNGPIEIGDLLVTSDQEGIAMKSLPLDIGGVRIHRPGTLIGKALEPLAKGRGEILVLLSLQ